MDKAEVARRQLGTALHMFLQQADPVSVHCLAVGGGEIAEWLAEQAGAEPFKNHILETFPDIDAKEIRSLRRKHWNAFKHATTHKGKSREDEALLASFDPDHNEHALFIGWYDYAMSKLPRPIEAQAFEAWYLSKYPEKVNPDADMSVARRHFPDITSKSPRRQLVMLKNSIKTARNIKEVMRDALTDPRPLVMAWK